MFCQKILNNWFFYGIDEFKQEKRTVDEIHELSNKIFCEDPLNLLEDGIYIAIDKETVEKLNIDIALASQILVKIDFDNVVFDSDKIDFDWIRKECLIFNLEDIQELKLPELAMEVAYGDELEIYEIRDKV